METTKVAPRIQDLKVTDNVQMLSEGRMLYVTRCTKCHNALRITRYTELEWDETLPLMAKKSKFNQEETEAVTAYVQAVLRSATSTN